MTFVLRLTSACVAAVLSTAAGPVRAQAPQAPGAPPAVPVTTAFILGRTIDGLSGQAIGGAIVTLSQSTGPAVPATPASAAGPSALSRFPIRVVSDGNGAFVFRDLPAGTYSMSGSLPGYGITFFGRQSPADTGTQLLVLAEGERRANANLRFWKYATINGRVLDEAGEPVIGLPMRVFRRTLVGGRLRYTSAGNQALTDDRGMYRFPALQPGDYVVGIVTTQTTVPTSVQQEMAAAEKAGSGLEFQRELSRSESGVGGGGAGAGQRVENWILQTPTESPFRSSGALPVNAGRVFIYPTTFHPAATSLGAATVIPLAAGEDRSGIDFRLRPVPTFRVSGMLVGSDREAALTSLTLIPSGGEVSAREFEIAAATAVTDGTGAFTFLGVPPGDYTIKVLKIPPRPQMQSTMTTVIQTGTTTISSGGGLSTPPTIGTDPTWWAELPVSVRDRDVSGVTLAMQTGARITGQLEFEGGAERPAADRLVMMTVQIERADGAGDSFNQFTLNRGVVDATGRFRTHQLPPGRYLIRSAGATAGWAFKSAQHGGRDVSDTPFELGADDLSGVTVVYTDRPTELTGTVRERQGIDASATVLIFPAEMTTWSEPGPAPRRFRSARVSSDGLYRVSNLPPGDYLAVAVRGGASTDWMEPGVLRKLSPLATRLTLAEGEKKGQDLVTQEVRR